MIEQKIPITLVRIEGITEVSMDLDDFESSNLNVEKDIKTFKKKYEKMIKKTKAVFFNKLTVKERWKICKKLADFMDDQPVFDIVNFHVACAKDLDINGSNLGVLISFGREFDKAEVLNSLPYSTYRVLLAKKKLLDSHGLFESEKKRIVENKILLYHKTYSKYLNNLIN